MVTLNSYFGHIYLINLARRKDRLDLSTRECDRHGIEFERFEAIDGLLFEDYVKYDEATSLLMRWNSGAAALVETTRLILQDAIRNNYPSILIMEDDIVFHPQFKELFDRYHQCIPDDWETFYFGLIHMKPYESINEVVAKVTAGYCCHCYAIKNELFQPFLEMISSIEKPIDHYTLDDIQPRGKSYCFAPNFVIQRADYSDIGLDTVYHPALKKGHY